jgi:hypothetical protein
VGQGGVPCLPRALNDELFAATTWVAIGTGSPMSAQCTSGSAGTPDSTYELQLLIMTHNGPGAVAQQTVIRPSKKQFSGCHSERGRQSNRQVLDGAISYSLSQADPKPMAPRFGMSRFPTASARSFLDTRHKGDETNAACGKRFRKHHKLHAGLANGAVAGGGLSPLRDRLANVEDVSAWFRPQGLPLFDKAPVPILRGRKDPFAWAFFTRLLFSALLDADRRRGHRKCANDPTLRGCDGDLARLKLALDAYLQDRFGGEPGDDLARLRSEVLADCRAAARQATGPFSLTVPTGGGKTLSSLAFALEHAANHAGKIDRIICDPVHLHH